MEQFEQLKSGELKELVLTKEQFLEVREELVKRADFKHFIGTAYPGGKVRYRWSVNPRT
ncbi:abortive phage infection protein [Tetzosporium hominis]|uniref:abortive phage infection protein n=1 Tax=Tetzosporium hominis TaxID=2020506 RepID=UPI000D08D216|nr:abortive phage infection protein [Tetzosporium hominis]